MDCPNCHMRNLGKSNAQVLEEFADELNHLAESTRLTGEPDVSESRVQEVSTIAWTLDYAAAKARAKAKEEN